MTYDNEWIYSGLGIPESDKEENLDLTTKNEERQQIINETGGNYLTNSDKATISMNSRRYGALKPRRKR